MNDAIVHPAQVVEQASAVPLRVTQLHNSIRVPPFVTACVNAGDFELRVYFMVRTSRRVLTAPQESTRSWRDRVDAKFVLEGFISLTNDLEAATSVLSVNLLHEVRRRGAAFAAKIAALGASVQPPPHKQHRTTSASAVYAGLVVIVAVACMYAGVVRLVIFNLPWDSRSAVDVQAVSMDAQRSRRRASTVPPGTTTAIVRDILLVAPSYIITIK